MSRLQKKLDAIISKYACLHDSVLSQKLFGIESDFVEKNPSLVREYNDGDYFNLDVEIKLFTNDKAGKAVVRDGMLQTRMLYLRELSIWNDGKSLFQVRMLEDKNEAIK